MKKYIVYDDKVYEIKVNEEYKKEGVANYYYIQTSPHTRLLLEKDDIKQCRQADTIEEFCDEMILFYKEVENKYNIPWATYEYRGIWKKEKDKVINEVLNHPEYRKPVLYAASWTDKGLIYVAKLNDKGELELI